MMKTLLALIVALMLTGCASFSKPEHTVGCQVADVVTTKIAISSGATEANPIVRGVLNSTGWAGLLAFKLIVAWLLIENTDGNEEVVGAANAATCVVAVHNLLVK